MIISPHPPPPTVLVGSSQPFQHINIARTLKNSWPTAPVTPTIAMVGPSETFAARTGKRTERTDRTVRRTVGATRTPAKLCFFTACISNPTIEINSINQNLFVACGHALVGSWHKSLGRRCRPSGWVGWLPCCACGALAAALLFVGCTYPPFLLLVVLQVVLSNSMHDAL